ncbi:sensor domain-containing diguanylate cyclase [Gottfriedia acidiceleris]|uniref:sensor domain-containing diguanylate cyclase n=1 Tax=Gottfriedia acidiceleris TaxID=371036 RepID=UPI000B438BE5|nr:sensor domain-containing diguanylate cyclase [Gottfriedia acidiceleris]
MINKHSNKVIWIAWIVLMPIIFYYANMVSPLKHLDRSNFLIIIALFLIVANMPIHINDATFSFIFGISILVFLSYGLFTELLISQLAYSILYLRLSITKKTLYRMPLNSMMFALCSVSSALFYYLVGGKIEPTGTKEILSNLFPILIYTLTSFWINQIVIYFITIYLYRREMNLINREFKWDLFIYLLMYPIGISLYLMLETKGYITLIYLSIYYIILMIILNSLSSALNMNKYLKTTMQISQKLSQRMEEEKVIDEFFKQLTTLIPVSYGILFIVEDQSLKLQRYFQNKCDEKIFSCPYFDTLEGSISEKVFFEKRRYSFNRRSQWYTNDHLKFLEAESLLSIPIIKNQEIVGVLTIASEQKNAYKKYQVVMIEILALYLAIAIENARFYLQTKIRSETDALTGVFNFEYLESKIKDEFERLKTFKVKTISLILIDLDYFKRVNDQYGHQAGNEVLFEVARRIKMVVGQSGLVARFGGEEFSVLLVNHSERETYDLAEEIRKSLEIIPFYITNHMTNKDQKIKLTVTASIGAAVAPFVAREPSDLIRCADRAMYSKAKNAGRNKVAMYRK